MAANDTLCFADFDPVTGPPGLPDGFFFPDAGVITNEIDPGYVNGSRMTFGGSGFPPVVFQGVRSGNFLHLAFLCRLDLSFDAEDVVVIALRPSQAVADQTTARRIDIFPVYEGVGSDEKNADTGGPQGQPADDDLTTGTAWRTAHGVPAGASYQIRTNHAPQKIVFWRGQAAGDPWVSYEPSNRAAYGAKVRSWKPVASPAGSEYAWSIEIRIPISQLAAGVPGGEFPIPDSNWINLADGFGLYFNVIRVGKTAASGSTQSQGFYSTQFRFPAAVAGNILTGILNDSLVINSAWYGTGLIPTLQSPPGSNRGQGVRFNFDNGINADGSLSVGRRTAGTSTWTLGHTISGTEDNELVAIVSNTSATDTAAGITAEFRFANWGLGGPVFSSWAKPPGLAPNPTNPVTLTPGAVNVVQADWPAASVPSNYQPPRQHQCIWVQLSSSAAVNFVQSSVRRNMDFINLSEFERPAEISGVGYPAPAGGSDHDFLLFTHARKIVTPQYNPDLNIRSDVRNDEGPPPDLVHFIWIAEGYRRTGDTLTIGDKTTEVLDESPGAFGFVAEHQGIDDTLEWSLTGPGLSRLGGGVWSLKVPDGGSVTINTTLKTVPPEQSGKWRQIPWWLWLIVFLFLLWLIRS